MFVCRFGTFEVNAGSRQLFKAGREIHLQEQPMRLLTLLLDRPGELHTREELQKRLWPNETFVEFDDGLNTAIQKIRQVLGDEARNPRFVETVPRQGYRFIAPVQIVAPPAADRPAEAPAPEYPVAAAVPEARRPDPIRVDWRVAAAVAALAGAGLGWVMSPKPTGISSSPAIRLSITPPPGVELRPGIRGGSAISPDGRSVVFAALRDGKHELWIRGLDSLDARPLPGTEGGILPFWPPDGKSIGFQSGGKIRRVDLAGGAPIDLAAATRPARGGWSESGTILFATGSGGPIQQVRATGGQASPVIPENTGGALWPFPVGSERFLYFDNTKRQIQFASLGNGSQSASLFESDTNAIYAPPYNGHPGQLLWLKGATLMAQAFDPASGKLSGDAAAVAEGVGFADRSRMVDLSVSSNGVLVYGPGNTVQSRLASIRRDGSVAQFVGEQDWLRAVRLSPDGRKALIERGIPRALWIFDFDSSVLTRATFEKEWSGWPVWSPDGSDIAYSGERDNRLGIYSRSAKGGRPESKLAGAGHDDYLYDWSRDGRHLIFCEVNPQTKLDLWVAPTTGDRTPRPFLRTGFNEDWPQFSPDGSWVVYVSDESGRNEVYVTSFPNAEGKWQISTTGGSMPRWAANGEIFFESAAGQIMVLQARPGARQFEWSSPRQLFANPIPGRGYDVTARGDRLLMMTPANGRSRNELTVILNWQAALPR